MLKSRSIIFASGVVLFVISIVFWPVHSRAQGRIHLGKLSLEPKIRYTVTYDDNIFSDSSNEKDDFIHTVTPSLTLMYQGARPDNYVLVNYTADLVAYSDYDDTNYQAQMPFVKFGYKAASGFYVKGSDQYNKTEDPAGSLDDFRLGEQTKRWVNVAEGTAGYEFAQIYAVETFARFHVGRYYQEEDKWLNRDAAAYGATLIYNWTPKTSFIAQYRRTDNEYAAQNDDVYDPDRGVVWSDDTSMDNSTDNYFLGARFKPGGKLEGEVKLGYTDIDHDNKFDPTGKRYADDSTWAAETRVTYNVAERTKLNLDLQRAYKGSSNSADVTYFIDSMIGFGLVQKFAYRLSLNAYLAYSDWDYQNEGPGFPGKSFDIYTARLGMDWEINEFLMAGLSYQYKTKDASNDKYESEEYTKNTISAYVEGRY